ncbi:hypothetical protein JTB14_036434 [Gonioctena quinquepunctata]|nr:hypothetical protein JTB14_036434 [Gonioctena quinquepunctata]
MDYPPSMSLLAISIQEKAMRMRDLGWYREDTIDRKETKKKNYLEIPDIQEEKLMIFPLQIGGGKNLVLERGTGFCSRANFDAVMEATEIAEQDFKSLNPTKIMSKLVQMCIIELSLEVPEIELLNHYEHRSELYRRQKECTNWAV